MIIGASNRVTTLSRAVFGERFVARGVALTILTALALMKYLASITALFAIPAGLNRMFWAAVAVILLIVFLVGKINFLCKILEEVANRAVILLYLFLPLSALAELVILIRNL